MPPPQMASRVALAPVEADPALPADSGPEASIATRLPPGSSVAVTASPGCSASSVVTRLLRVTLVSGPGLKSRCVPSDNCTLTPTLLATVTTPSSNLSPPAGDAAAAGNENAPCAVGVAAASVSVAAGVSVCTVVPLLRVACAEPAVGVPVAPDVSGPAAS